MPYTITIKNVYYKYMYIQMISKIQIYILTPYISTPPKTLKRASAIWVGSARGHLNGAQLGSSHRLNTLVGKKLRKGSGRYDVMQQSIYGRFQK